MMGNVKYCSQVYIYTFTIYIQICTFLIIYFQRGKKATFANKFVSVFEILLKSIFHFKTSVQRSIAT